MHFGCKGGVGSEDLGFILLLDICAKWLLGSLQFIQWHFFPHFFTLQGELDQERLTRQQELTALYQMQHLQYQQFLIQ